MIIVNLLASVLLFVTFCAAEINLGYFSDEIAIENIMAPKTPILLVSLVMARLLVFTNLAASIFIPIYF